jgi:hypothetical protein
MDQVSDPVREGLKSHIRELEQRALELKRAVNSLDREKGEPPSYQDNELKLSEVGGSLMMKKDEFYGQKIHTAMRHYLTKRKAANLGPATLSEIYQAMCDGGLKFETENEENRKTNMRFLLRKNTSIFHRLPDKQHFALTEWYPGIKDDQGENNGKKSRSKRKRAKPAKAEAKAKPEAVPAEKSGAAPASEKKVTQEQAVRAALDAVKGDFKRQDIVEWIGKRYPLINAEQKRDSIFAMLGKLKDEIEIVTQGKGAEPSIYRKIGKAKMNY